MNDASSSALGDAQGLDLSAIDPPAQRARATARLDRAVAWPREVDAPDVQVRSGWFDDAPRRVWASVVDIAAPLDVVARWIADEMIERLPAWSAEFVDGAVVAELPPGDAALRRVVRARYRTPPPLADREYTYWLERYDRPGEVLVTYQSVPSPGGPSPGAVTARLDGTAHRMRPVPNGTRLEHVLVTDLGGRLPGWMVDHVFRGGLRAAHLRDARALARVVR